MKLLQYFKETKAELKEVVFPTSSQTIIYTVLVILISIFVAAFLWAADLGFKELLTKIVTRP
jgi:preprotein translocase subunit SecE